MKSAASESEECFYSDPNYVEVTALEQERFALQIPKDSLKHLILAESEEFKHFSLGHSSNICWKSRTEIMEQPARASKLKSAAAPWPQYTVILQESAAVLKLTAGNIYTACGTNTEAHCLQKHHTFSKLVQLFTLSWVTPQWKNHRVLYRLNTSSEFYRMFLRTLNSVRHWAMRQNR